MKMFFCTCVNPDYETLGCKDVNEFSDFIDESKNIEMGEFIRYCDVSEELKMLMEKFPHDFDFFKNGEFYFYTHSMIEHFFR